MARKAGKVWLHKGTGYWCAKVNGRRLYLAKEQAAAQKKLDRLLAGQGQPETTTDWSARLFDELAEAFLADCQARLQPYGYRDYKDSIERARPHIDPALTVGDFKKIHLRCIECALSKHAFGSTTINKTLHAVQRVFNWAVEVELLASSPLLGYKRPPCRERTRVASAAEFQTMLRYSRPAVRRLLVALRQTGCRPGEVRGLRWEHVNLEVGLWILPEHKTARRQHKARSRIIPLPPAVWKLCRWLHARKGDSPYVFLSHRKRPWALHSLKHAFRRLRKLAGLAPVGGEHIVPYTLRHTFATNAVGKVADKELAELLGHSTPKTLNRYVHISSDRLHDIAKRARGLTG